MSGWLVALAFTSGPIVFFISLAQGQQFAKTVALATLVLILMATEILIPLILLIWLRQQLK